jgi:hypothetical protein
MERGEFCCSKCVNALSGIPPPFTAVTGAGFAEPLDALLPPDPLPPEEDEEAPGTTNPFEVPEVLLLELVPLAPLRT